MSFVRCGKAFQAKRQADEDHLDLFVRPEWTGTLVGIIGNTCVNQNLFNATKKDLLTHLIMREPCCDSHMRGTDGKRSFNLFRILVDIYQLHRQRRDL